MTCGAFLVGVPCLWFIYQIVGYTFMYWHEGFYPSRYGIGIFVLTMAVGAVMVLAGLDIFANWRNSK